MAVVLPAGVSPRYDSLPGGIPDLNVDAFLAQHPVENGDFASFFVTLMQTKHKGLHSPQERISWIKTSYPLVIERSITDPIIKKIALQATRFFDDMYRELTVDRFSYVGPQVTDSSIAAVLNELRFDSSDPISFFINAYIIARDCSDPNTEKVFNCLVQNLGSQEKTAAPFAFKIFAAIEEAYMISPIKLKERNCCSVL